MRIMVVSPVRLFRDCLAATLGSMEPVPEVVAEVSVAVLYHRPPGEQPDVVLVDVTQDIGMEEANQFGLPAATICALYKSRWQVELFFKWIKQHLRIKRFFGISENAVKTQIWIAVSIYVLVAIVKKRLTLDASLYTLLQILSVTLFEKIPMEQALTGEDTKDDTSQITNQLNLFPY